MYRTPNAFSLLYRTFYHDARPYAGKAHTPVGNRPVDYARTPQAVFRERLFKDKVERVAEGFAVPSASSDGKPAGSTQSGNGPNGIIRFVKTKGAEAASDLELACEGAVSLVQRTGRSERIRREAGLCVRFRQARAEGDFTFSAPKFVSLEALDHTTPQGSSESKMRL